MCAINPSHKKRIIFDVYTSDNKITKEEFDKAILDITLELEIKLNSKTRFRWHTKETTQEAE